MEKQRIMILWAGAAAGRFLTYSVPPSLALASFILLLFSWACLGFGGCLAERLDHGSRRLQKENAQLQEHVLPLGQIRELAKGIETDGRTIRGFLGLEKRQEGGGGQGQGGFSFCDLSRVALDAPTSAKPQTATAADSLSLLERTKQIRENLRELLQVMREQRNRLDYTPSIIPVDSDTYSFSSGFGWRQNPFTGKREFHSGLDISDSEGTPIIAPANGVVLETGASKLMGMYLRLDHGRGCTTSYAHLARFNVKPGDKVKRGQVLGLLGNTGKSSGPHVHYRIDVNHKMVNPRPYILNSVTARAIR
ncbi:MAG TPA: M23 family metallopeptidase [Syntrophobacteria bacterium]|nr:M23 family metallopeptidase [Syntrophobacteria bacterium]